MKNDSEVWNDNDYGLVNIEINEVAGGEALKGGDNEG